jgi:hypothetical protein
MLIVFYVVMEPRSSLGITNVLVGQAASIFTVEPSQIGKTKIEIFMIVNS